MERKGNCDKDWGNRWQPVENAPLDDEQLDVALRLIEEAYRRGVRVTLQDLGIIPELDPHEPIDVIPETVPRAVLGILALGNGNSVA